MSTTLGDRYSRPMETPPDVVVIGEALVDFVPHRRGALRNAASFEMHSGGAPANVAIHAARNGVRSALVTVVGDDEFGAFLRTQLAAEGVDVRGVRVTNEAQTGLCFITLDSDGDRSFTHRGGSPSRLLCGEDLQDARLRRARVLQLSSGPLRTAEATHAIEAFMERFEGIICCDPGTCPGHWARPAVIAERLRRILPRCQVVKCADDETRGLTGLTDPAAAARRFVEEGAELGVVTLGPRGALWARARDTGRCDAPRVSVVDTTGAGDAFMGALVSGLARTGTSPSQVDSAALHRMMVSACAAGSQAVTRMGSLKPQPVPPCP